MLWLCILLPRLPFEALSLDEDARTVVTLTTGRARNILVGSQAAERSGLTRGMAYATASALHAQLQAVERNSAAEHDALERLAAWAYQWSSRVIRQLADAQVLTEHSALWIEIAASFKLFGGRATLLQLIERDLQQLGYDYRLGIAPSLEGAALLARAQRRVVIETPEALRRCIAPLPLEWLAMDDAIIAALRRSGVRVIGALFDLPSDALARRFGVELTRHLDRLLGRIADPRPLFQLPKRYRARCELAAEVTNAQALLFPLRRMLQELQGYLRAIDSGLQHFVLQLRHRQSVTRIVIGCSAPERDAERFFILVRERFERLALPAPVIFIELQADRFAAPPVRQNELFHTSRQTAEHWQALLDRLSARLGQDAVRGFDLIAEHRAEKAWRYAEKQNVNVAATQAPRPLWLLIEPRRIPAPALLDEPERIESGWWDGADARRDYYFVRAANGARWWIYRDLVSGEWFLHGLCG